MYKVTGIENLTESFTKTYLVGLAYYTKNFQPELIIYLKKRNKLLQIVSKTTAPNDAILFVEEVQKFTIPTTSYNFYTPKDDNELEIKIDTADNVNYNYKETAKLGQDQVLFTNFFSINIENKLSLILNEEEFEEKRYIDFIKILLYYPFKG